MSCNVGKLDRILRIVVGLVLIVVAVAFSWPWGYIGIIPLVTGLIKFCPLYTLLKINTSCEVNDTQEADK
jgi:preprotein translocase subunit SecF